MYNGNVLPSIPVGHAVHMKETYDNMKELLRSINYEQDQWQLCGDLKVVVFARPPGWILKVLLFPL